MKAEHWSTRYLGMRWVENEFDCGDFAALVQREVFGRSIALPRDHGSGALGRSAAIAAHQAEYVLRTEDPKDGDAVLLYVFERIQHLGLLCLINGERWVVHNQQGVGVTRVRLRDLISRGYRIEGFYAWI
jgi:hypothetical protein